MVKNYSIEVAGGITSVRFTKNADLEDIRNAIDDVAENHLNDLRLWDISSEGINLTGSQIKELATYGRSRFLLPSRVAIVAQEDLAQALMRVHEIYSEEDLSETRIFSTDQEALKWLNSRNDKFIVH